MLPSRVQPFLNQVFNANYNLDIIPDEAERPKDPIVAPFNFYDRHVASNFALQRVVCLSDIPQVLSATCDIAVNTFWANGNKFSTDEYSFKMEIPEIEFTDARTVRQYYRIHIGPIAQAFTSKLCVHPHVKTWPSILEFMFHDHIGASYMSESILTITRDPKGGVFLSNKLKGKLTQPTIKTLNALLTNHPTLAMWHVFPMVSPFTTILQSISAGTEFKWETSHTGGYRFLTQTLPPTDAKSLSNKLSRSGTSHRSLKKNKLDRSTIAKVGKYVTPPSTVQRSRYRPDFKHYLQCAWTQASIHDTTYIILHCGRYERIGIRHRATQTLYLSGVIDTVSIQDPCYRKLHIGLHIAIFQDALERMKASETSSIPPASKAVKRSSDGVEGLERPPPKRQRSSKVPSVATEVHDSIAKHLVHRKLALVSLDYGVFSSSVPSSFRRIGESCKRDLPTESTDWTKDVYTQKKFNDKEYITLKLLAPLGRGAVGVVHPAQTEVMLSSGVVVKGSLVVKLAFSEEQQSKLKAEFEMYCRMSRLSSIKGVLDVHGLFYDVESNVMALLMADGGKTLRQREIERTGKFAEQVTTTQEEREAFTRALESIHQADIRHCDIRADNLTIDSDGKVYIIDFDCAEWHSPDSLSDETSRLNEVLEGNYIQRLHY
ncbi:hypothetical protein JR316_0001341 [Psilocybe cubensis]|uniref:Uncharacterized protein n=2 Tax=Psilocybe cubensis TaxID=181762 RepID=A0ACB8HI70_PSICU|nr:hypothetical protein JR316_0001341 [Psilocybe cubensis]KAH9487271.1 hypothetical protein JR316_0001341 [Psilocybe cubensis]